MTPDTKIDYKALARQEARFRRICAVLEDYPGETTIEAARRFMRLMEAYFSNGEPPT